MLYPIELSGQTAPDHYGTGAFTLKIIILAPFWWRDLAAINPLFLASDPLL